MHKKNTIEKNLTEHVDRLRHDAFMQHKDFDQIAKKRLLINQAGWYVKNRPAMQADASAIWWEEATKTINTQYKTYQKTSLYARISSTVANICSIGIYRLLA